MPLPNFNHVKADSIQYLSFEGGGGKGVAYLGPLIALLLPEFNVFKKDPNTHLQFLNTSQVKGISGTSAGAITAALLACKVPVEEIGKMSLNLNPLSFSQETKSGVFPAFNDMLSSLRYFGLSRTPVPDISVNKEKYGVYIRDRSLSTQVADAIIKIFPDLIAPFLPNPYKIKARECVALLDNLKVDWGLAPGYVLREHIDNLIAAFMTLHSMGAKATITDVLYKSFTYKRNVGITFLHHYKQTGIELVLTGTNISRRQVAYFSYKTTPNLCIADAVRISMSIPGFFKPVIIKKEHVAKGNYNSFERVYLLGEWADGGMINNNPIHAFDVNEAGKRKEKYEPGLLNPFLLPIRLGRARTIDLNGYSLNPFIPHSKFFPFLNSAIDTLLDNSTELQFFNNRERGRSLDLTTELDSVRKLDTFDFSPQPTTILDVVNKCVDETLEYFTISKTRNPIIDILSYHDYSNSLQKGLSILAKRKLQTM